MEPSSALFPVLIGGYGPWGDLCGLKFTQLPAFSHREELGVVLHKDSKWYQQWKDFKDNNIVFNREYGQPAGSWARQWQQILDMY